jgi:hypothetical protein
MLHAAHVHGVTGSPTDHNAGPKKIASRLSQGFCPYLDGQEICPLIAPRGMFFSSCRAVHQQLSSVAQSYPQIQRFLAEGSDRALSQL